MLLSRIRLGLCENHISPIIPRSMVVVVFLSLWMRVIWVGIRSVNLQYDGVFLSMLWLRVI